MFGTRKQDRVRSALINSGYEFPNRRLTINLAPADLPKDGARLDLPIAMGILAASGQIDDKVLAQFEFVGELALMESLDLFLVHPPSLVQLNPVLVMVSLVR